MRAIVALGAAALSLSACQSAEEKRAAQTGEIDVANAPSAQVAKLMKAAATKNAVRPGLWRAELKLQSIDLGPDAGAQRQQITDAMKRLERSTTSCRTADNLAAFDLEALEKVAGTCVFVRYRAAGGKVQGELVCKQKDVPATRVTLRGTTGPTAFDVVTEQQRGTAGQAGYVGVTLRATGTRIGDCAA
jgi:hypothetical protein